MNMTTSYQMRLFIAIAVKNQSQGSTLKQRLYFYAQHALKDYREKKNAIRDEIN